MAVVETPARYPGATWAESPHHWPGHKGRKAVVIHINEGHFESSIAYMLRTGTSAHFEVGADGRIAQLVGVQDSAWCNGLSYHALTRRWVCPHGHVVSPSWDQLDPADENPNWTTLSIENEGFSGRLLPPAQFQANVDLLVWLGARFPSLVPYTVGRTLIGHSHLDSVDKARCPGSGVSLVAGGGGEHDPGGGSADVAGGVGGARGAAAGRAGRVGDPAAVQGVGAEPRGVRGPGDVSLS